MSSLSKTVLIFALSMTLMACTPEKTPLDSESPQTQEKIFIGMVMNMERPAPDIAYDYKLVLKTPFLDEVEDGAEVRDRKELILTDYDETQEEFLEKTVVSGSAVEVTGKVEWGYAESRVLHVTKIK